jgi:5-formyltetrahydrofolate cyclo-ligase
MIPPIKQTIRRNCQQLRKTLPHATQQAAARKICDLILALDRYHQATQLALYHAVNGEIDLSFLWDSAVSEGKICCMPALDNQSLVFLPATPTTPSTLNRLNIPEPNIPLALAIPPARIDLMLIPLVAFDDRGTRLGQGGGFYDRALAQERPPCLLGVAYDFQRQPFIPAEAWDIPLTGVVTERGVQWYTD